MDEDKFNEMYDVDCCIQVGLQETFMHGAGMVTVIKSFGEFLEWVRFEWWEEHIMPSRERIMIRMFGEDDYEVYNERSLREHWE